MNVMYIKISSYLSDVRIIESLSLTSFLSKQLFLYLTMSRAKKNLQPLYSYKDNKSPPIPLTWTKAGTLEKNGLL